MLLLLFTLWCSQVSGASRHTNNWAVLVDTSRFWYNYRHAANTLSLYRTVKRLGIPDSNIILMIADDVACNPRNPHPGKVFNNADQRVNIYGDDIEVDYRGEEVTVESFLRVLLNRHDPEVPRSKRLLTDSGSNVLIFLTGHGGEEFLKFQDSEEILSRDLADAVAQMHNKARYHEMLFMVDTCQGASLFNDLSSPGIITLSSSASGESSYSHHIDFDVGVSVIDRFSFYMLEFFERVTINSRKTVADLFRHFRRDYLRSTPTMSTDLYNRPIDTVLLTDFFGSVMLTEETMEAYPSFHGTSDANAEF